MTSFIFFQAVALFGGALTAIAYLPQIFHLIKVKNSSGNSLYAWYLWLIGAVLPLIYSIYIKDFVFIIIQISYIICISVVIIFIYKYRKNKI